MTIDLLAAVQLGVLAGFAGVGVAVVNQALPTGSWPRKPWSCRTCMSAWGALVTLAVLGVPPHRIPPPSVLALLCEFWALWAAATGVAHLVLGLADAGPPQVPDFNFAPESVPPGEEREELTHERSTTHGA